MPQLENLTWPEAETLLRDAAVILIPLGARLKEHGYHLPLNNDWVMAERLAARVLREVEPDLRVAALPTVPYGHYPAFLEYPGSTNIALGTFRDFLADLCRSICAHGPRKVYILNTGVSTLRALEPARALLVADGIELRYTSLRDAMAEVEGRLRQEPVGTHADEIETSLMLALAPEIVRMDRARRDIHPDRGGAVILSRDAQGTEGTYSPTGTWGDPTLATREKGQAVADCIVRHVARELRELAGLL